MKKTPIIFITCLLFLLPLEATESKQYAFQQIINTQNGLSSSVRCLTVSHEKGYVWIGTRSGIGRFDGYELKKFLHDNITHIFEDNENKVWATTPKGLYYYNDSKTISCKQKTRTETRLPPLPSVPMQTVSYSVVTEKSINMIMPTGKSNFFVLFTPTDNTILQVCKNGTNTHCSQQTVGKRHC